MSWHSVIRRAALPACLLACSAAVAQQWEQSPQSWERFPDREQRAAEAQPEVISSMRKAESRNIDRRQRDKALARLDLQSARFADAYHRLRPHVAECRDDVEYLALLALAALRVGNHAEAMVVYRHLADVEPELGRWRIGLALAREQLGLDPTVALRDALMLSSATDIRDLLRAKLASQAPGVG